MDDGIGRNRPCARAGWRLDRARLTTTVGGLRCEAVERC